MKFVGKQHVVDNICISVCIGHNLLCRIRAAAFNLLNDQCKLLGQVGDLNKKY